jgi:hypothetical protein
MKENVSRRDFLKTAGFAALGAGSLGLIAGCGGSTDNQATPVENAGEMT